MLILYTKIHIIIIIHTTYIALTYCSQKNIMVFSFSLACSGEDCHKLQRCTRWWLHGEHLDQHNYNYVKNIFHTIRTDLKEMKISEDTWYEETTTSRAGWRVTYRQANADINYREQHLAQALFQVQCPECQRTIRKESDKKRLKCSAERQKPVAEQSEALQCSTCKRWFRSHGGFTVCNMSTLLIIIVT